MPATAECRERVLFGCLEFGQRRNVTAEDIRLCVELACRVRVPDGRIISRTRLTHFVVVEDPFVEPIGVRNRSSYTLNARTPSGTFRSRENQYLAATREHLPGSRNGEIRRLPMAVLLSSI
jgi:hypothetical protein